MQARLHRKIRKSKPEMILQNDYGQNNERDRVVLKIGSKEIILLFHYFAGFKFYEGSF